MTNLLKVVSVFGAAPSGLDANPNKIKILWINCNDSITKEIVKIYHCPIDNIQRGIPISSSFLTPILL